MIYLSLFFTFFKLGCFAFGGAHGSVPLFRAEVLAHDWMSDEMFTNIVSISESTPGPIMVNTATYIGSSQWGLLGGILATLGVVLPSFIIILLVTMMFQYLLKKPVVQGVLKGVKQCIMGLILATGIFIGYGAIFTDITPLDVDVTALIILVVAVAITALYKKVRKKELSSIAIIICCAVLGGLMY